MKQAQTLFIVEVAVFTALAFLLDLLSGFLFSRIWPQGGSVSIAMVPIFLMSYRWGIKGGMVTGLLLGLLQFVLGFSQIYHPIQGIVDYLVAFALVGLAGVFASQIKKGLQHSQKFKWIALVFMGVLLGSVLRYLAHVYSGVVFFGEFAPEGQPVVLYSFVYNGTYMLPSAIISGIVVILVMAAAPKRMVQ